MKHLRTYLAIGTVAIATTCMADTAALIQHHAALAPDGHSGQCAPATGTNRSKQTPVMTTRQAGRSESAQALIKRLIPAQSANFICESIPAASGKDIYEIESVNGKIILRGNSGVALASAFYHYLKEQCRCHISWNGDQLNLPATLPAVPQKIRVVAPVEVKFAYNYCTHGYTMAFWGWEEWERELDWLALHGINMALIIEGQEAVWQNTFSRFGYTKEEIRQWLCSPVYQPWQYMQNMEGVMPPPQPIIDQRVALGQKIVQRCRELGIRPVLQGFYGMIPSKFKGKFPDAKIVGQGGWAGGNHRPDMLHIKDPRFIPIATAFLEEQKKLFGECHHFAADPFHEGGNSGDMNRGKVYKVIQDAILKFDSKATCVKQCWQASNKEMFDAGDKSRTLALDLFCEGSPFWSSCNGYDGTPWVWCHLGNFGGNIGMEGNLPKLANDFGKMLANPKHGNLAGIGIVPEGSHQNPVTYELMTEMGWRGAPANLEAWIGNYLHARYGKTHPAVSAAWQIMLQTNYAVSTGQIPLNTVIAAAPRFDRDIRGRTWSPGSKLCYDNSKLFSAWGKLLEAAPELGSADTFRFDLADTARQTLCNLSRPVYDQMTAAYQSRDQAAFKLHSQRLLQIIRDLDALTATRSDWLMGKWIANARKWGSTEEEGNYAEHCARLLLTTWVINPHTDLSDYANREWNGLLGQYYLKRWELFIAEVAADLDGKGEFNQGGYDQRRGRFEVSWITGHSELLSAPQGDTLAIARNLHAAYAPLIAEYSPKPGKLDKYGWNSKDLSGSSEFTLDISDKAKTPGSYAVTFQWKSGDSALSIDAVSLVINGETVCTDRHPGWTGWENKSNVFTLKAEAIPANAVVELKISGMKGASGDDSSGVISAEKLKPYYSPPSSQVP